jgi:hypothetical protein
VADGDFHVSYVLVYMAANICRLGVSGLIRGMVTALISVVPSFSLEPNAYRIVCESDLYVLASAEEHKSLC